MACEDAGVTDIVRSIMINMPAAEPDAVELEIRNILTDFFNESRSWREWLTLNLVPDKETYDISVVDNASITAWVLNVVDELGISVLPAPDYNPASDEVYFSYTVDEPTVIRFTPTPAEAKTYRVRVSKQLKNGQMVMPSYITTHFRKAIFHGVLGNMYGHTQKPYSDPAQSMLYKRSFETQVNRARDIANRGFTRGPSAWQFPQGFARGSGHLRH